MAETKPQNFANHTRWDPPFHFFVLPVFVLGLILTLVHFFAHITEGDLRDHIPRVSLDCTGARFTDSGIQSSSQLAQGSRPRHPSGRAVAPDAPVAGTVARPYPRVDRRPALRSALRLRRRASQVGRARNERKIVPHRNQEGDPDLAPRLLASVNRKTDLRPWTLQLRPRPAAVALYKGTGRAGVAVASINQRSKRVIALRELLSRSRLRCCAAVGHHFVGQGFSPAESPLSPPFHPHSSVSDFVSLGASWVFSFQPVLPPVSRPLVPSPAMEVGQAIRRSHRNSALGLLFFLPWKILTLCCRRHRRRVTVAQRFVHFSAHPQAMQQHRELSRGRNHGSFLPILPATLGQLQTPAPQIAVRSKRTQNVVRSLHQQRSQIRIAFLADVHLRLALAGVPPSRLQPHIAAHVAASR